MPEIMRVLQALEVPRERWLLVISYLDTIDPKETTFLEAGHMTQGYSGITLTKSQAYCLALNAAGCYPLANFLMGVKS